MQEEKKAKEHQDTMHVSEKTWWTSSPVDPSDGSSPSCHLTATMGETPSKNLSAEPSQLPEL